MKKPGYMAKDSEKRERKNRKQQNKILWEENLNRF